jgi:HEPN family protein
VLRAIERELKDVERMLRGLDRGELSSSRCEREVEHKIRRLSFRLEMTPAVERAMQDFHAAVAHYANNVWKAQTAEQKAAELSSALDWLDLLRASLENSQLPYATRNEAEEFAVRTRKNLEYVINGWKQTHDVHVVTQLTVSLLGLIVYPWEKQFAQRIQSLELNKLEAEGWPNWNISLGEEHSRTLGQLANRLRNAVAHRRITFSSDSPDLKEVEFEFEDQKPGAAAPHWRAYIQAPQLLRFCIRFTQLIEAVVG